MGGTSEYGGSRWRMDTDIMGDANETYLMETRWLDWKHQNSNYLIFNLIGVRKFKSFCTSINTIPYHVVISQWQ